MTLDDAKRAVARLHVQIGSIVAKDQEEGSRSCGARAPRRTGETGVEALDRMVEVHAAYSPRIDDAVRALEAQRYQDPAVAAALRDRLKFRWAAHRAVIERIAAEGELAPGWTIDAAADLFYAVTLPGPWRELTGARGWSANRYARRISQFLRRGLLASA